MLHDILLGILSEIIGDSVGEGDLRTALHRIEDCRRLQDTVVHYGNVRHLRSNRSSP